MLVARDKTLHEKLDFWNWSRMFGDMTSITMFDRLCTAILKDDVLTIQLFFEHGVGAMLDYVVYGISFFNWIVWYSSLETIEMCCWYMCNTLRFKMQYTCDALHAQTNARGSYAEMIKDKPITRTQRDQTCRSSPSDAARNDIDIATIWQRTAYSVYHDLCNVFPNPLASMVMAYAMQPLAPPHVSPGNFLFFFC